MTTARVDGWGQDEAAYLRNLAAGLEAQPGVLGRIACLIIRAWLIGRATRIEEREGT
jgi:hypothetical protein